MGWLLLVRNFRRIDDVVQHTLRVRVLLEGIKGNWLKPSPLQLSPHDAVPRLAINLPPARKRLFSGTQT